MADDQRELSGAVNALQLNGEQICNGDHPDEDTYETTWGFPLPDLYKLALQFYKEKNGKALHISYKDKVKLVAFTKQVSYGKYRSDVTPEVGFLDVVGNDRRQAWLALGDKSKDEAMVGFIEHIDKFCPMFKAYIEAHKAEKEERERRRQEEEEQRKREEEEKERCRQEEEVKQQQVMEREKQAQQEQQIRAALNQQTSVQFRQYALQQYSSSPEQQETLIQQLQEQHFQQYMQQVYQQQLLHQQQQRSQLQAMGATATGATATGATATGAMATTLSSIQSNTALLPNGDMTNATDDDDDALNNRNVLPPVAAASMWTRKDIAHFKDSLRKDPDSVIKVGSGETVTVRVPTHEDGTCLFWEFASDSHDLGFGVYFEWTIAPSNQVSVHVSESSDEEELEDEEVAGVGSKGDVEKGSDKDSKQPPTDEIIPVYRRDCHEEVYCGSHMYPGQGVYLLKFDNSYSLWRSKTLYYRVYYTR